ncbi:hypothetical protein Acsp06_20630 [Actinomycetospora sp. NBRC 106375]|uniref:glycoside hydrolase family 172 protein n=1 Tax=Actinomycetospora sp. NBRC 106375 TaxID=3032207 RepID=UPI0024A19873|nr:glycoside hydrolase family 172 protein [Actinomycetospora sp. NBRC 106375]GLZ45878.1 hypothetical protein Acsp06_20630 [Actinomycetospora sp. NBRC 106375]
MTVDYGPHGSSLRDLPRLRRTRRRRSSSWDRTGGNDDRATLRPGETATMLDVAGAGVVTHLWVTVAASRTVRNPRGKTDDLLRRLVLRAWWDGEEHPSVAVPLGDFFGVGHGRTTNFVSLPLQMSPEDGKAFNCWFAMPFGAGARMEITSEVEDADVLVYFYVDYEELDEVGDDVGRFHAQWRRQLTQGVRPGPSNAHYQFGGTNLTGNDNYTILEAEGHGHYVGCVLNIQNRRRTRRWNWYGEGDDMIFIDGDVWPPTLHGTGTEDYVNTAWCPTQTYSAPYHGVTLAGGKNWRGPVSLYRFHIEDPVVFQRSIRVSIEHGHANRRSDDWSSVAYWYQAEPHTPFEVAPVGERLPHQ